MASSKKLNFKVETNVVPEKKRRKSDLVVMWQSIFDVTSCIVMEFWAMILKLWQITKLWFDSSERLVIQSWLEKYLHPVPTDFAESWRDGCLVSVLLNKLQPGVIPDAATLDPDYGLRNVNHAFYVLETYFNIEPNIMPEEVVVCVDGLEDKLFKLFVQLKQLDEFKKGGEENSPITEVPEEILNDTNSFDEQCIAKGTGLVVGFVQRMTHFIVFFANSTDLDIVIDIKGPEETFCSERITKRSPKKRCSPLSFSDYASYHISRSVSCPDQPIPFSDETNESIPEIIPLEYEVLPNQVHFGYKPLYKGEHKVTVLWHGQHVSDSPYLVSVENPPQINGVEKSEYLKPALKTSNSIERANNKKTCVRFEDCKERKEPSNKTLKKRVLRYIMKIDGKDVAIDTDRTDALATELLKMDYEYNNNFSLSRRNSWGFTGDAERKISVIRQFCVNVNDIEAQSKGKRSKSLSSGSDNKKSLSRSDSFDNLNLKTAVDKKIDSFEDFYGSDDTFIHADFDSNEDLLDEFENIHQNRDFDDAESMPFKERYLNSDLVLLKESSTIKNVNDKDIEIGNPPISSFSANISPKSENLNDDLKQINFLPESFNKLQESSAIHQTKKTENKHHKKDVAANFLNALSKKKNHKNLSRMHINKPIPKQNETMNCKKLQNFSRNQLKLRKRKNTFKKSREKLADLTENNSMDYFSSSCSSCSLTNKFQHEHENDEIKSDLQSPLRLFNPSQIINSLQQNSDKAVIKSISNLHDSCYNIKPSKTTIIKEKPNFDDSVDFSYKLFAPSKSNLSNYEQNNFQIMNPKAVFEENIFQARTSLLNTSVTEKKIDNHLTGLQDKLHSSQKKCTMTSANLKTHTLLSLGQYHFKQFNPSPNITDTKRVKSRILEWELAFSRENEDAGPLRKLKTQGIEAGDVKAKLSFWESTSKKEEISFQADDESMRIKNESAGSNCLDDDSKHVSDDFDSSNSESDQIMKMAGKYLTTTKPSGSASKVRKLSSKENSNIFAEDTCESSMKRSCSDPAFDIGRRTKDLYERNVFDTDFKLNYTNLSSSNELDLVDYSTGDEDSLEDQLRPSTEDEYIDDEISENTSMYWGELSLLKKQKPCVYDAESKENLDLKCFRQHYLRMDSHPSECKIFGIANYFGYVAVKNRFQVLTKDAGAGNLSVSVQGFGEHDVSLASVAYTKKDIYEVTYQVMTAGYYLISVRWMDTHIPGSPYVCKVTF